MKVTHVPYEHIDMILPHVKGYLEAALAESGGRYSLDSLMDELADNKQTLWVAINDNYAYVGATTVSIIDYPEYRALCYEQLGGKNVSEWLEEGHKTLSAYALENGCKRLECQGRSGWKPFLMKLGYRLYAVRYEFDLKEPEQWEAAAAAQPIQK